MADVRSISSLEDMRSLFAEAGAVAAGSFGGKAAIVAVGELKDAGGMVLLMDSLILQGWEFKRAFVLRRLARADALLASIADGPLRDFLDNPVAPNLGVELRRLGWKLNNVSRIHGHRSRIPGLRVPRQPMLNRLGNTLRRLGSYAIKQAKPLEYIQRRLRLLRDEVIPASRSSDVLVTYPILPPPPAAKAVAGSGSSSSASTGTPSTGSSTSTARSSTPSTAPESSSESAGTYNSSCSACVEGRPHGYYQSPVYLSSSSTSTAPSSRSSGDEGF